ncbi:MAG: hypothetical protein QOF97_1480 [Acidimicrobiaceae bacterium]
MHPRERHSPRRRLALLGLVAVLVGMAANGAARAQSTAGSGSGTDLASQFGGYELNSRGNGFVLSYDSPGLLPVGSPLFEVGLPESQATQSTGPSGYALASLAYPGSAVADLGTLLAVGGAQTPIPPYPVRAQSFFPGGPTTADQVIATASAHTTTTDTSSDAVTQYNGADLPSFMKTGTITVTSHTALEEGQVVSRIRVEETDVNMLFGVLQIGSIVTDLVGNSNGTEAASDGTTTVTGVKFAGRDAIIDSSGIHLVPPKTTPGATPTTTPLDPITGPLGGVVDPVTGGVAPATDALSQLITTTVGAQGSLNDLLKASGIKIQLLAPIETKDGGQVTRLANGLLIEVDYDGRTQPVLSQLIGAVPASSLPADSLIPGVPLNSSPQALFNLLKEKDVVAFAIASGAVKAVASPAFEASAFSSLPTSGLGTGTSGSTGGSTGRNGFSTATPSLGTPGSGGGGGSSVGDILPIGVNGGPLAAVVSLFALALLGSISWFGSGRLADNVLSEATSSCPEGLDRTTPPTGGSP